jgi:hypothetical protein
MTKASRLKGFRRAFAVHSNSGANAATAAMAVLLGRNQERGPFLSFSESLNPPPALSELDVEYQNLVRRGGIASFKDDWADFLYGEALPACGVQVRRRSLEDDTMRYLNAYGRRIPVPKERAIQESCELLIPTKHHRDYEALKALIISGADLKPYLSRDVSSKGCPDRNDGLLNAWGIQHLHFRKKGTKYVLFCLITDQDILMIQALSHDDPHVWVDTSLLQILHDNWPEAISAGRVTGVPAETFSAEKRHSLREQNSNYISTMSDGTVYAAPGGGVMSSGHSADDQITCDKLFTELEQLLQAVMASETDIRRALNWTPGKPLILRMMFEHRYYCLYEPTTRTRIKLNLPAPEVQPKT